jgi:hypothetical protein
MVRDHIQLHADTQSRSNLVGSITGNACAMPWHPPLAEGRQAPGVELAATPGNGTGNACAIPLGPRALTNHRKRLRHAVAPAVSGGAPGPRCRISRNAREWHRKRLRHAAWSACPNESPETLAPCRLVGMIAVPEGSQTLLISLGNPCWTIPGSLVPRSRSIAKLTILKQIAHRNAKSR